MKENRPELREEIGVLVSYPQNTAELERACSETFSNVADAWFTAVDYSPKSESGDFRGGVIPSPQLAKLADLHWTNDGLEFAAESSSRCVFRSLRKGKHRATIMDAALLVRVLSDAGLRLCWRLYGWKWRRGGSAGDAPMREYWALYTLGDDGFPKCVGGGTWLARPHPVEEALPW